MYKAASFVRYSTVRDALTDADFTGKNLRKSKEESNKVSVAVNREDVKLVNGGGKDYTEIKGSYEQRRVSNDKEDVFSGVRSFVLPQGEYQIQDAAKKKRKRRTKISNIMWRRKICTRLWRHRIRMQS